MGVQLQCLTGIKDKEFIWLNWTSLGITVTTTKYVKLGSHSECHGSFSGFRNCSICLDSAPLNDDVILDRSTRCACCRNFVTHDVLCDEWGEGCVTLVVWIQKRKEGWSARLVWPSTVSRQNVFELKHITVTNQKNAAPLFHKTIMQFEEAEDTGDAFIKLMKTFTERCNELKALMLMRTTGLWKHTIILAPLIWKHFRIIGRVERQFSRLRWASYGDRTVWKLT